ncbi:hypothetical protein TRAPUB_4464 [Trametes pubescens]|uniref:Uncharacterized protein n=1 Tax=Trametes pubescens TaxID=154538 RepID=A0A1M2VAJ1_TRAPU|nr:hypothetical protein TRAPUB_4464 [Trametes pubescens]
MSPINQSSAPAPRKDTRMENASVRSEPVSHLTSARAILGFYDGNLSLFVMSMLYGVMNVAGRAIVAVLDACTRGTRTKNTDYVADTEREKFKCACLNVLFENALYGFKESRQKRLRYATMRSSHPTPMWLHHHEEPRGPKSRTRAESVLILSPVLQGVAL